MKNGSARKSGVSPYRGKMKKIDPVLISEYLEYDESSPSCLRWVKTTNHRIIVGSDAGVLHNGVWKVKLFGIQYPAHRLVWALFNDDPGDKIIDHINRDPSDNRIENLRTATHSQNVMNAEYTGKTSEYRGVYRAPNGKFRARLRHRVAWFDDEIDAARWWNNVASEIYGEFALLNNV